MHGNRKHGFIILQLQTKAKCLQETKQHFPSLGSYKASFPKALKFLASQLLKPSLLIFNAMHLSPGKIMTSVGLNYLP